jgi:hypothetical protein
MFPKLPTEPKIANLQITIPLLVLINKDIGRFDIPMKDLLPMTLVQSNDNLIDELPYDVLGDELMGGF